MYYIYKFTNKINGKTYIGQTNNIQKRYNGHKSVSFNKNSSDYNLPFHCAIRKYGIENFDYEVLEEIDENESQEFVDEREIFFINEFKSLKDENGYNVTLGGQGFRRKPLTFEECLQKSKLFTKEEILDIQNRLINDEEFEDIEAFYAPRLKHSFLGNINCGWNFKNPDLDYPLKKHAKSKFSQKQIQAIKARIKEDISYSQIAKEFGIKSLGFISGINSGRYFFDKHDTYPLCEKECRKTEWVEEAFYKILFSEKSIRIIAEEMGKAESTLKKIGQGRSHRKEGYKYPIRSNLEFNRNYYQNISTTL